MDSNYQIEDYEEKAMKKSDIAKKAAAAAGVFVAGGGTAFAASNLTGEDEKQADNTLTPDELVGAVTDTVNEENMGENTEQETAPEAPKAQAQQAPAQPVSPQQPSEIHVYHHIVDETPDSKNGETVQYPDPGPKKETDIEITKTTVAINDEGEIVAAMTEGTKDGQDMFILDEDGDGIADVIGIDENGDHEFQENEIHNVKGKNIGLPVAEEIEKVYINEGSDTPGDPEFLHSTTFVTPDGQVVGQITEGTLQGHDFAIVDEDGDGIADKVAVDANDDHVFQPEEVEDVRGYNIAMHEGKVNETVVLELDEPVANNDIDDIRNDFTHEKAGEVYGNDFAQNNPDYKNNGDVRQYADLGQDWQSEDVTTEDVMVEDILADDITVDDLQEGEHVYEDLDLALNDESYDDIPDIPDNNDDLSQYDII